MNLVRNERVKLLATYLNGAAIAAVAVGGFSQVASIGAGADLGTVAAWIGVSISLHLLAQGLLGRLRE